MMLGLFETAEQRRKDERDLDALHLKYADEICNVLEARVNDDSLRTRDRKHWRRLLRKARQRFDN